MSEASRRIADALPNSWVERILPQAALPYAQLMRLDRPIGWWLLLLPCWWGLLLAHVQLGDARPNLYYALLFLLGAIIMRGAGCTGNDLVDRKIDAQVARTRNRPIPSGRVSPTAAALFIIGQAMLGLVILLQFNRFTVWLSIASLLIVAVYPFMKRITYWPQLVLGLAFNWGALVGWTSLTGSLVLAPALLYAGGVLWTLAYDTIYAHQDMEDDVLVGVKSTALKFGERSKTIIAIFFTTALILIDAAVWQAGGSWVAHAGVALAALHALWQVKTFEPANSPLALRLFKTNKWFGLIITAAFFTDVIWT